MIKVSRVLNGATSDIWYNGSSRPRLTWDLSSVGKETATDQEGPGLYFTTSLEEARGYGDYISFVNLNISKNRWLVKREDAVNPSDIKQLILKAPDYLDTLTDWDENPNIALRNAVQSITQYSSGVLDAYQQVWHDFYRYHPQEYLKNIKKYDAGLVKRVNSNHAIVFHPEVIQTIKIVTREELNAQS